MIDEPSPAVWTDALPLIFPDRFERLGRDDWREVLAYSMAVAGEKYFVLVARDRGVVGGGEDVEIYALSSELVAAGSGPGRSAMIWDDAL